MNDNRQPTLKAVFFLEQLPMLAPMIAAWRSAGHEIAAVVMPGRHNARFEWLMQRLLARIVPHRSLPGTVGRHAPGAAIHFLPQTVRWDGLAARMAALKADVLISAFFPRRIPETLLSCFRFGGVNLHPSRLPYFRGPSPLQHMLLQDGWRQHGGVTLHRMSAGLDEGDVIAYAHLDEEHWISRATLNRALGGAMANLAANAVPAYCRGEIGSQPQPEIEHPWAGEALEMTVDASWRAEHLQRLLRFFGHTQGVYLAAGTKRVKLGAALTALGPPTGAALRLSNRSAEFDLADARVLCRRPLLHGYLSAWIDAGLPWLAHEPPEIPFIPAAPKAKSLNAARPYGFT